MVRYVRAVCASAVAALFPITTALAEGGASLSEDEVRSFFSEMEESVVDMVRNEDYESLLGWVDESFAEEASFFFGMDVFVDDERKSFTALRLDKDDLNRLGRISVGVMAGMGEGRAITDYSLDVEVLEVVQAGPDAATVTTRFTESATFSLPQGRPGEADQGAGEGEPSDGEARSIEVEATADCQHLIRRNDDGAGLVLGLTGCGGSMHL